MWLYALIVLTIAVLGLADDLIPKSACATQSTLSDHGCILTYTPYATPQIPPISTVYDAIVTTYYYVVDCHICTVTNALPSRNHPPEDPFTTRTTVDVLTVSRVACIPQYEATTRGVEPTTTSRPILRQEDHDEVIVPHTKDSLDLQDAAVGPLTRRSENAALIKLATKFGNDIPPDTRLLPGQAQHYLTAVWSAMFALQLADSGLDTKWACAQVQAIEVRYQLKESWLDPDQIKGLVCWIAEHGYYFNTTRAELYSTLQAAIYALQVTGDFTSDRSEICKNLDLFSRVGGYLGIDTKGFEAYVCKHLPSETSSLSGEYEPTSVVPLIPYPTNSTTSWGHTSPWKSNTTILPTGFSSHAQPTSFQNITSWTATGSGAHPTNASSTHPTGFSSRGRPTSFHNITSWTGTSAGAHPTNASSAHPTRSGNYSRSTNGYLPSGTDTGPYNGNLTSFLTSGTSVMNSTPLQPTVVVSGTTTMSSTAIVSAHTSGSSNWNDTHPIHIPFDPHTKAFYPAVETHPSQRDGGYKQY